LLRRKLSVAESKIGTLNGRVDELQSKLTTQKEYYSNLLAAEKENIKLEIDLNSDDNTRGN
jgi:hypothetical protein